MLYTSTGAHDAPTMEAAETVARRWWLPLIAGVLTVAAGVVVLAVDWTAANLAWVVGAIFIYRGLTRAMTPTLSSSARTFNAIAAVASVIAGVAFVAWPSPTLLVLAVFIGAYLVVDGIFHMAGAIELRHDLTTWWLDLIFGAAVTGIGFLALRRPDLTLASLVIFAGLWAIVVGTAEIVAALLMRSAPRELARAGGTLARGGIEETIVLGRPSLGIDGQLAALDQLHLSGGMTDAEYERVKSRLTAASAPAT
jgi:uncharacterized membrane protein HdeD (DUF308 family)